MLIKVGQHKCEIEKSPVNELEVNVTKVRFEFDPVMDGLVKEAYFTLDGHTYKQIIENNECDIPSEVLVKKGQVTIGVVAFEVEGQTTLTRYNPSPAYISTLEGSLKTADNTEPITPSEMEQFEQTLQEGLEEVNSKLGEVETAITEANNLNLDVSKSGKVATVEVTKKDGTTKSANVRDGYDLDYDWEGTSLGIKREDEQQYEYTDLKGEKGDTYTITQADYNAIADVVKSEIVIPKKTSDLTNDSGFITNTVNNLTNYYLKSQTYTKEEVNNIVGQVAGVRLEKVDELPETGQTGIIYLVPNEAQAEENIFDEYIWVDNDWELIGSTQVDLTGYATEDWVSGQISDFVTESDVSTLISTALTNYYTKTQTDNLLSYKANTSALADYVLKTNFLTGSSAPTTSTFAPFVGALYVDTTNNNTYQCFAITTESDVTTYTWKKISNTVESVSAYGTALTPDANGNVNIPRATGNSVGLVSFGGGAGISMHEPTSRLIIDRARDEDITPRTSQYKPIVPYHLNFAVKSALSDANHLTMNSTEQGTAKDVLGVSNIIFNANNPTTSSVGKVGDVWVNVGSSSYKGSTYYCSAVTPQGTTPETYTYTWTYINQLLTTSSYRGISLQSGGMAVLAKPTDTQIDNRNDNSDLSNTTAVVLNKFDYAVKKSITTSNQTLTDAEKTSACSWLGTGKMVTLTQAAYDALVSAGTVDADTYYYIVEE